MQRIEGVNKEQGLKGLYRDLGMVANFKLGNWGIVVNGLYRIMIVGDWGMQGWDLNICKVKGVKGSYTNV